MNITYLISFLIFGLIIGSFLNVLILRMDELKTVVNERSHCPKCKKILPWYDLIPFFSFLLLRAKCRFCKAKISWQYPIVELSTGIVFAALYLFSASILAAVFYAVIFSILTVVLVYDIRTETVPEVFVWIALILSVAFGWYFGGFSIMSMIFGILVPGLFLGSLVFFSKEKWMGAGDIKIGMILGALAGYPVILAGIFIAFFSGSVVGLICVYMKNRKLSKDELKESLPFAPFLIFSALICVLYGKQIVDWYLGQVSFGI